MAHILYRGGASRSGDINDDTRAEEFRPDEFLYGECETQSAEFQLGRGSQGYATPDHGAPEYDTGFEGAGYGVPVPEEPRYDDQFAQQTAQRAARGRMNYAPSQHPIVHQSLMQAVRDENPAVQHFIDLQRAAEARAAELALQLAAREAEARAAAERAREEAEAYALAAQDGHGWAPDYRDPRVQAAATAAATAAAQSARTRQGGSYPHPHSPQYSGAYSAASSAGRPGASMGQGAAFVPQGGFAGYLPAGGVQSLMRRTAGLASVVMALGLGIWGYQLAQRDIAGLQVIKAPDGPGREAPLDPGGELARHTGLAVNSVAAIGTAAPGPDQVTLAPRPAQLDAADAPMSELKPLPTREKTTRPEAPMQAAGERMYDAAMPIPDASFRAATPTAEAGRVVIALGDDLTPPETDEGLGAGIDAALAEALPDLTPPVEEASAATLSEGLPKAIAASVPGLSTSPRPLPRPQSDLPAEAAAVAVATALAPEPADAIEISPDDLAAGTRLVQIGAHDSVDLARAEWDRVSVQFEALMAGKRRVIQEAVSGGRTFYRLRVEGFKDVTESRHFCAALVAERTNCIPAQVR